jgi:hypothetical protein
MMWPMLSFWNVRKTLARSHPSPVKIEPVLLVSRLPICAFCLQQSEYDGETVHGVRKVMCSSHFHRLGPGSVQVKAAG